MKAIFALIGASILIIVIGVMMILNQPEPPATDGAEQSRQIGVIPAPEEKASEIPQLEVDTEPGTEPWCEQMMKRPGSSWTREDSQIFADNCIYE